MRRKRKWEGGREERKRMYKLSRTKAMNAERIKLLEVNGATLARLYGMVEF